MHHLLHGAKPESSDFLPGLTRAFVSLDISKPLNTREFVDACAKVVPFFDHIGATLSRPIAIIIHSKMIQSAIQSYSLLDHCRDGVPYCET